MSNRAHCILNTWMIKNVMNQKRENLIIILKQLQLTKASSAKNISKKKISFESKIYIRDGFSNIHCAKRNNCKSNLGINEEFRITANIGGGIGQGQQKCAGLISGLYESKQGW